MQNSTQVNNGGVTLNVVTYGDARKVPIVLVHGYPDNHTVWKPVAERLAGKYFVITYDVRGAGASSVPKKQADYRMALLSDDLRAVVDAVIPDQPFHLAGHDWGSIQSWESVTAGPLKQRILSYTTISGPCLDHMGYWMRNKTLNLSPAAKAKVIKQLVSSWYIGFFHLPVLAPAAWQGGLDKLWPHYLRHREQVSEPEQNPTQEKDGRNGVQLYRANFRSKLLNPEARPADCPVQLVVPTRDNYVGTHLFDELHEWVPALYRRDINANHWVPLSHPDRIAQWIGEFVAGVESGKMPPALEHARVRPERLGLPLAGKAAIITGAGSGIGRATALRLAEVGADVVCVDINEDAARETANQVQALGAVAWSRKVDVGSAAAMQTLAKWVEKELGCADIVVNNAGIGMAGGVLDTSTKDWDRILKVNLWGVIHGSRLFGQQMVDAHCAGHIINVASAAAFAPNRKLAAYATTKAAVHMLTECLRAELSEHDIGVTSVCPGFVATGIAQNTVYAGLSEEEQTEKRAKADSLYQRHSTFTPESVAERICQAVLTNPAISLVGPEAIATRFFSRFAPGVSRLVARLDITP
ncbi:SDR family oxidoreductase [Marinobacter zhejiangensis]|uniref:Short-chain dehydrogenase n=1 Tax=Marinobacter zhejiangensis TaxID=488535 RepID=A0A1I4KSZ2_9GAMM|nr:SDR family oxidoreductase [Marinobacter zhejiangensis]SFL81517.1 Short-chain dehydrogenase [Marinobacter zhejiangensis]